MKYSSNEIMFKEFLDKNKIEYIHQYKIDNIPFNRNKTHMVDFYLPKQDIYVEIKGFMTIQAVNILKYLLYIDTRKFYILQMTEEDWIEEYNKEIHKSVKNKILNNIQLQFEEIISNENTFLQNISIDRLENYIKVCNNKLEDWKINK